MRGIVESRAVLGLGARCTSGLRPSGYNCLKSQPRTQDARANRTRHTTSSSTQPHAKQQPANAPQTNLTFTRTHTPPERRTMAINRRHRPASQPHSLSHPHARASARSPVKPSPARSLHRPLRQRLRPLPPLLLHLPHNCSWSSPRRATRGPVETMGVWPRGP